jgi:hypothetical protein
MAPNTQQWPTPLYVSQAVERPAAAEAVRQLIATIPGGGPPGGITIRFGRSPRVLVYVGPLPDNAESDIRDYLKSVDERYQVSPIRDPGQIKPPEAPSCRTSCGRTLTPERFDDEYVRTGTANLFMISEPLLGWKAVSVTGRRTAKEFAEVPRWLVEDLHPGAEKVVVLMDNLDTHKPASLYEAFPMAVLRKGNYT